jgi:CheY-like chemotaxis protein
MHRVLVIEDEDVIRESLLEFLQDSGYDAVGAVHGQDALDKLADGKPAPCVILLDLMMPVMDGQAFREEQLKRADLSRIPVVVISAYQDLMKRARSLNAVGHLNKPLHLRKLLEVVREHCPLES